MQIAVVGCGYVFDHYMSTMNDHAELAVAGLFDIDQERLAVVSKHYGLRAYASIDDLLADPAVELVVNLTSIDSHYEVTKAALEAGKHVYCEKPFTMSLASSRELMDLAVARGLQLSGAPCNAMSETVQTLWRAVRAGAVGRPRLVYAEFDDNPVYLMQPESWRSRTGAPWPYKHEYEAGCTVEHAGYYLSWLCAMFGPAASITAFSRCLAPDKTDEALDPADSPDFSVACIVFKSGVTARLTISIIATFDQRLRIVGDEGELSVNTYRDYNCPVRLERFSGLTLNARKARWVRENSLLQWILGVGGRSIGLLRRAYGPRRKAWRRPVAAFKRMQLGAQDKCLGVAEMASAIRAGRAPWLTPQFILHVTELTLAMQRAGDSAAALRLETTFEPLAPLPFAGDEVEIGFDRRPGLLARLVEPLLVRMHAH